MLAAKGTSGDAIIATSRIAADERARDAGLVRGIGPVALAIAIVNGVVGSGIFALPARLSAAVGPYAPLAYVACAIAMAAVVICFAEAGSRVPTSGGAYGTVEAAFGPLTGFVQGMLLWLSAVLACGGVVAAIADAAGTIAPALHGPGARALIMAAVLGTFAAINILGVRAGTGIVILMTLVKLVPLGLFVAVGWFAMDRVVPAGALEPAGFGRAVILALFAFSGMETILATSGEVRDPARTVPRALIAAMLFVLLLYVAVQLVAQGLLGAALATSAAPLADGMMRIDPRLGALLLAGTLLSLTGWVAGDLLGGPRFLFAFGRDGLLPAALGRLHPRTAAPWVAILVHAALALVLALTGTFENLAVLAGLASCGIYSLACAAALVLRRRGVATQGAPLTFAVTPIAAVIGIASMVTILFMGAWAEIAGFFGVIAASVLLFLLVRRKG
ncbi:amino acid/polyamine/organocation transporter, APC superfamily [Sphingomonas jatrophae]|uniref:Arginine/agmatine antiporter n=2 Tax=Sphingomonas jatrophae TaxID=1166337 RepID=A0A1I6LJP3_9SPHN|nr:amino acid/polyamine/organocation transporter, APC superfamily [Sphingomonas jatrophae]